LLLHKEEEQRSILKQKEDERQRLDGVSASKVKEIASKNDAVSKLTNINHQLLKTQDIEKDRLADVKRLVQHGPSTDKMALLNQELVSTATSLDGQQRSNKAMSEKIIQLKCSVTTEQKKMSQLEKEVRTKATKGLFAIL